MRVATALQIALAVLCAIVPSVSVQAQSLRERPVIGTWRYNPAESEPPGEANGAIPLRMFSYHESGFIVAQNGGVNADGNPTFSMSASRYDGSDGPSYTSARLANFLANGEGPTTTSSYRIIDERTVEITFKNNGEVTGVNIRKISEDGNKMTETYQDGTFSVWDRVN